MIKIEKGVPMPPKVGGMNGLYPFSDMSPGDSFALPLTDKTIEHLRSKLSACANGWAKRHAPGAKTRQGPLLMSRYDRNYLAGRYVAQEARKDARAGDHAYATSDGAERFASGAVVNTDARKHPPMHILERDVLAAALQAVALHPSVAWAARMNTGGVERDNADGTKRYIAFAFAGCSDIIGQMKSGKFLAIEVKKPGGKATAEQLAFLCRVHRNHGVAFVAWSVDDVMRGLAGA